MLGENAIDNHRPKKKEQTFQTKPDQTKPKQNTTKQNNCKRKQKKDNNNKK